tara:strand:+ start:737 stop:4702 length:3966 start_codon:yes stop_codon:yes gene_type:complete
MTARARLFGAALLLGVLVWLLVSDAIGIAVLAGLGAGTALMLAMRYSVMLAGSTTILLMALQNVTGNTGVFDAAIVLIAVVLGLGCRYGLVVVGSWQAGTAQRQALLRLCDAMTSGGTVSLQVLDTRARLQRIVNDDKELAPATNAHKRALNAFLFRQPAVQRRALAKSFIKARDKGFCEVTETFISSGGETCQWRVCMAALADNKGRCQSVLVGTQDLTQQVKNQAESQQANAELCELLDSLDGVFIAVDDDLRIVFTNAVARDYIYNISSIQVTGANTDVSIQSALPAFIYNAITASLPDLDDGATQVRKQIQEPNIGRWLALEVYKKNSGYNLFIRDIDEQHQLHLQHKEALMMAEMAQELESVGSWIYDLETRQMHLSAQACKVLDIPAPQQSNLGLPLLESLFVTEQRIELTQAILQVTHTEQPMSLYSQVKSRGGTVIDIRLSLRCLFEEHRQAKKIIGSVQDVSEQKARETYLLEAERQVRGIIDALPNQICVIDRQGNVVNVNRSWLDSARGYQADPGSVGRGTNYLTVCDRSLEGGCDEAGTIADGIRAVINGEQPTYETEYCLELDSGQSWYVLRVNPLVLSDNTEAVELFVISHENITALKQLMLKSEAQREQLELVQTSTNDGIWDWQIATGNTYYSPRFYALLKLESADLPAFDLWLRSALLPAHLEAASESLERHLRGLEPDFDFDCQLLCGDQQYRWFRLRGKAQFSDHTPTRFVGAIMDISEHHSVLQALSNQQRQFDEMAAHIPDVFFDYDLNKDEFTYISPAFNEIWQQQPPIHQANALQVLVDTVINKDRQRVTELFKNVAKSGKSGFAEYRICNGNNEIRWISSRCFVVKDEQGEPCRLVGTSRDVTQSKLTLHKLKSATELDTLTALYNRHTFLAQLDEQIQQHQSCQRRFAIVFIDIDRLTTLNDSVGYVIGDKLLQQIASRLRERCPPQGVLARMGGDEFALLLPLSEDEQYLTVFLSDLIASFNPPFSIDHHNLFVTVSAGACIFPRDGHRSLGLLRQADVALQSVKRRGGGFYQIVESAETDQTTVRGHLESELKHALDKKQFVLHYQPKVATQSGKLVGCEALLRWQHPEKGLIPPFSFVSRLENSGLIVPVGEYVIEQSLLQLKRWQAAGLDSLVMAVNVSPRQLLTPGFVSTVSEALIRHDVDPCYLELELTETALVTDPTLAVEVLEAIKQLGVSVAIDDFGTGYSSLSYLRTFKPQTVKIDKAFVDDIEPDNEAHQVLTGIVSLCEKLGINTVAEGVERDSQWTLLRQTGCALLQGYLFAKPLPADDFVQTYQALSDAAQSTPPSREAARK